jgi:hypothetical protein
MEYSTVDCAEWDRCSYEHHPVDDLKPIDTASPAYREASLQLLKVVGIIDTFLAGSRDAQMAAVAFSIAFGLPSTRGDAHRSCSRVGRYQASIESLRLPIPAHEQGRSSVRIKVGSGPADVPSD